MWWRRSLDDKTSMQVVEWADAEHGSTGCATGLAVRRRANLAGQRKR